MSQKTEDITQKCFLPSSFTVTQRTSVKWTWKLQGSGPQFSSQISSVFGHTCAHLASRARTTLVSSLARDHTKIHIKLLHAALKQKATTFHLDFKSITISKYLPLKQNQWHITHLPQSWHSSASLEHGSLLQDSHFQPRTDNKPADPFSLWPHPRQDKIV